MPAPGQFIIDSNNNSNRHRAATTSTCRATGGASASNVGGYYNTGYWVASTTSSSDPVSFWFNESGCLHVEAWWTSGSNRPSAITFLGWNDGGSEVGRAVVDQRSGGGQWNSLGDWEFGSGWNRVLLSRWAAEGSYAIADAVRVSPSTDCN